jgi:hypothetical protein
LAVDTEVAFTVGAVIDARAADPPDAVEKTTFVLDTFVAATFAVETDVITNNVGVITLVDTFALELTVAVVNTAFVAFAIPVDTLVDASTVPLVSPVDSITDEPLADVATRLFVVKDVVKAFAVVIDDDITVGTLMDVVARNDPLTSNVYAGTDVLIPTFPPVVNTDPTVLELPTADKVLETIALDAVIFVSTTLVDEMETTESVPVAKFPEIESVPPVIVDAVTTVDDNVLIVADTA